MRELEEVKEIKNIPKTEESNQIKKAKEYLLSVMKDYVTSEQLLDAIIDAASLNFSVLLKSSLNLNLRKDIESCIEDYMKGRNQEGVNKSVVRRIRNSEDIQEMIKNKKNGIALKQALVDYFKSDRFYTGFLNRSELRDSILNVCERYSDVSLAQEKLNQQWAEYQMMHNSFYKNLLKKLNPRDKEEKEEKEGLEELEETQKINIENLIAQQVEVKREAIQKEYESKIVELEQKIWILENPKNNITYPAYTHYPFQAIKYTEFDEESSESDEDNEKGLKGEKNQQCLLM